MKNVPLAVVDPNADPDRLPDFLCQAAQLTLDRLRLSDRHHICTMKATSNGIGMTQAADVWCCIQIEQANEPDVSPAQGEGRPSIKRLNMKGSIKGQIREFSSPTDASFRSP